jgi:nitrate/TMAO reductase-like tetraheme cytochrome c subunit
MDTDTQHPRSALSPLRLVLAALCVAGLVGLLTVGRMPPEHRSSDVQRTAAQDWDNTGCRDCHLQVWEEWQQSYHSKSWTSPDVQAAFQHFGYDRKCESCHAPESVFQTGLSDEIRVRSQHRESGVDCLSCHALEGARVAARRTLLDAPCRPTAMPELTKGAFCGSCHRTIYGDWLQSPQRAAGKTCQTCHLPEVAQRPGGASHLCLGGHDDALVRSGVEMHCRQEGARLLVDVHNHATGHNYPGERHNRELLLQVLQRKPGGEITLAQHVTIKQITPFSGESSAEQIRAGETFQAVFPVVDPPVAAEVTLLYKRFPWHRDDDALMVHQQIVELESP